MSSHGGESWVALLFVGSANSLDSPFCPGDRSAWADPSVCRTMDSVSFTISEMTTGVWLGSGLAIGP